MRFACKGARSSRPIDSWFELLVWKSPQVHELLLLANATVCYLLYRSFRDVRVPALSICSAGAGSVSRRISDQDGWCFGLGWVTTE
jgi:hypothetical protein